MVTTNGNRHIFTKPPPATRDSDPTHIYPPFRARAIAAILQATDESAGKFNVPFHSWRLFEGYRSPERQAELYAQGRTRPGAIVTNARASNHTRALAVDVVWVDHDWRPQWDGPAELWAILGHCARAQGLVWGGDWMMHDTPHIEPAKLQLLTWRPLAALWLRKQSWR